MSKEPEWIISTDGIIGRYLGNSDVVIRALKRDISQALRAAYQRGFEDGSAGREAQP